MHEAFSKLLIWIIFGASIIYIHVCWLDVSFFHAFCLSIAMFHTNC